jgi:outer membrane protein OmpA-like peptidoglycan-associated protein
VGLALFAALLLMGGIFGIVRACAVHPAHHPAAAPATSSSVRPHDLVGGGGVPPRAVTGKLAVANSVGQVLFAEAGTALDRYAQAVINNAAQTIRARHPAIVTVTGYTDAIGGARPNQRLSLRRARAVLRGLRPLLGGIPVRYFTQSRGQAHPVASNATAAGRQLNRRVVITISMTRRR